MGDEQAGVDERDAIIGVVAVEEGGNQADSLDEANINLKDYSSNEHISNSEDR